MGMTAVKRNLKFLLISIFLHLTAFILLMQTSVSFNEGIQKRALSIDFFKVQPPKVNKHLKPPKQPVEKSSEQKSLSIPKPTILQDVPAFKIDRFGNGFRFAKALNYKKIDQFQPNLVPKHIHQSIATDKLIGQTKSFYQIKEQNISDKIPEKIETSRVDDIDPSDKLSDASPSINQNVSIGKRGRGEGLMYYSYANSFSSGVSTQSDEKGEFYYMMLDLANDIAKRAQKKIDVVFVLDTTGSMDDNIRGVRAYTGLFFDQLKEKNSLDVAMGLVTFSDVRTHKPYVYGVTTKIEEVKNKLFDIEFTGGSEIAESGLDALISATNEIKFRKNARKFFVLISDGPFHDADYDEQSQYSLDEVIEILKRNNITVDVVGIDYLPIKQIAYGTGGDWRPIPGKGDWEKIYSSGDKSYSHLGALSASQNSLKDEVIIHIDLDNPPNWIRLTYKLLNPLGEKCYQGQVYKEKINPNTDEIKLYPNIIVPHTSEVSKTSEVSNTYTLIYRVENSKGEKSILRRMVDLSNVF